MLQLRVEDAEHLVVWAQQASCRYTLLHLFTLAGLYM
jgi:hypothetical protein